MEKLKKGETYEFNLKFEGKITATVIGIGKHTLRLEREDGEILIIINFYYEVISVEDLFGNKIYASNDVLFQ
jgi:hypothetical protein